MNNCEICGKPDNEKPQCFRGEPWCSEYHRKMIKGEIKGVVIFSINENSVMG